MNKKKIIDTLNKVMEFERTRIPIVAWLREQATESLTLPILPVNISPHSAIIHRSKLQCFWKSTFAKSKT